VEAVVQGELLVGHARPADADGQFARVLFHHPLHALAGSELRDIDAKWLTPPARRALGAKKCVPESPPPAEHPLIVLGRGDAADEVVPQAPRLVGQVAARAGRGLKSEQGAHTATVSGDELDRHGIRDDAGPVTVSTNKQTGSAPGSSTGGAATGIAIAPVIGYLVPAQQIAVSPIDAGGQLIEHHFVEGKQYEKGTILAKIDPTNYLAAVEETKSLVSAAQSRLAGAEQRYKEILPVSVRQIEKDQVMEEKKESEITEKRAKQEYDRLKSISESSSTAVAPRELQQAEADFFAAKARTRRLEAAYQILEIGPRQEKILAAKEDFNAALKDLDAAKARLSQSQWKVDNCTIRMPITGTVLSKKAELYSLVNPLAFGATSGSLCDIADLANLEVDLEIPEKDIGKIQERQPCRIVANAFPERTYDGELFRIMPIANRSRSVITVRVKVKLPAGEVQARYLKPEMGTVVTFLTK